MMDPETMSARNLADLFLDYERAWDASYALACSGDKTQEARAQQRLQDIETVFTALGLHINVETDTFRPFVMHEEMVPYVPSDLL